LPHCPDPKQSHSIDSFITDSANSASALYSGHKSTVNAMGVYADSSPDAFDDPKVETIVELLSRIWVSLMRPSFGIGC
jgi:alkaline phosphatase